MRQGLMFALFAAIVAAAIYVGLRTGEFAGSRSAPESVQSSGVALVGGPFALVDQSGGQVTEAMLLGRFTMIYFGYTFCPDVCPVTLQNMILAIEQLGRRGADVTPVLITVDPERDTVEALAEYAGHFPGVVALTGSEEQIAAAAGAYRVYFRKGAPDDNGAYLMDHTSLIYLMGPDGRYLSHFSHSSSVEEIVARLREVL